MRDLYKLFIAGLLCVCGMSCIENDIPYPVVALDITNIEGEGFTLGQLDTNNDIATLTLSESCDIRNVVISSVETTEGATLSKELVGTFDMRTPLFVTLSLYQQYPWQINATQDIVRYFQVEGQIGEAVFDIENRIINIKIGSSIDLEHVKVLDMKLGGEGVSTLQPTVEDLQDANFYNVKFIEETSHGRTERWVIETTVTDEKVTISSVDAWSEVIWIKCAIEQGAEAGIRYRKVGDDEWSEVPTEMITTSGGELTARLSGVEPSSEYEIMAYSDQEQTPVVKATTSAATPLENGGFELWSKKDKVIYPALDSESGCWSTGNYGATLIGDESNNLTKGDTDTRPNSDGEYSAYLKSQFVGIGSIGKFAAGNLFIGEFVGVGANAGSVGTNGVVRFGTPSTLRPTKLRGWYKYNCGVIDRVVSVPPGVDIVKGETPDIGSIYVGVGDWTAAEYGGTESSPVRVDTYDKSTFFNKNGKNVIGAGELQITKTVGEWTEFTIELDYTSTSRIPTHLVIVCSASNYGDYFTGSTQSALWLDDFELLYD